MHCRLCGEAEMLLKYEITRFDPAFNVYECASCGFLQQDISENEAYDFYDEAYYRGKKAYSYIDERNMEKASREVWKARFRHWKKLEHAGIPRRFLDVGCSFGGLMQTGMEAGYESYGAEVSAYSGAYARERFGEKHVFTGNIERISLPKDFFNIVSMIEVIEHLYNPRKAVENIFASLKEKGLLVIQTANMAGLQAQKAGADYHYFLPGHLSYFNRFNLERLLLETGFSKTRFVGGVEFGLLPKLLKSQYSFKNSKDYLKWFKIAVYHLMSRIPLGKQRLTSSMVMLAWK